MWQHRSPAGFTLVELLAVLVILGILAGLAAPSLTGWIQRERLHAVLSRFTADLYHARALALRSGERVRIHFERGADGCVLSYTLLVVGSGDTLQIVPLQREYPGLCVTIAGSPRLTIDSRGMPVGAARSLYARLGGYTARLRISIVGRVYRDPIVVDPKAP